MSDENQSRPRQVDQARAHFTALKSEDIEAIYAKFGVPPPAVIAWIEMFWRHCL